jgi:UDP-N-acetylmuramoyl-tripeptide--D-alanyl-D-alanine ligase
VLRELVSVAEWALAVGALGSALKWVRVAQREHYLPGRLGIFFRLWYRGSFLSQALLVLGFVGAVGGFASAIPPVGHVVLALMVAVAALLAPVGLGLRGRTSPLALTKRLRRLLGVVALVDLVAIGIGLAFGKALAVALALGLVAPLVVEFALRITAPIEHRLMQRYVDDATERLRRVRPVVVGITGSFGKTTTKHYVTTLLEGSRRTVATPASFNNRGGLARSINEHLVAGTEVFVAEMGTFGPGEIAALCTWVPPDIAVITAIGPVHLERFGSEAAILRAKLEITEQAQVVILNVDYPRLALAAKALSGTGSTKKIVRVSATTLDVDVAVRPNDEGELVVFIAGRKLARIPAGDIAPTNLACAVAVALQCQVTPEAIAERLTAIKSPPNRLVTAVVPASGVEVLDDTYNSNPTGARRALAALARRGRPGASRLVVTPGMVELGDRQYHENQALGRAIAQVATHLVVVGRTNRDALLAGVAMEPGSQVAVHEVRYREQAVALVRELARPGDVVLYENDLPDHYP